MFRRAGARLGAGFIVYGGQVMSCRYGTKVKGEAIKKAQKKIEFC